MMLQHYTSKKGLEGIAKSKSFWATDFSELNDTTEWRYGYTELSKRGLRATMEYLENQLPDGSVVGQPDYGQLEPHLKQTFDFINSSPIHHDRLYVTSFALPETDDQNERGLLTLWDRYTKLEGYCLQYAKEEILCLLDWERGMHDYLTLELNSIIYEFQDNAEEYRDLVHQYSLHCTHVVAVMRPDLEINLRKDEFWPDKKFIEELQRYCAIHKSPFFVDEREMRIVAIPRPTRRWPPGTTGLAKKIKTMPGGRKYIELADGPNHNIEPQRIIIGPKADVDIDEILEQFDRRPEVINSDLPIR